MFFTLWLLFCFVLTSSYVCTLHSELTVPNTDDAIKSFDDLVKSNLPVRARIDSAFRDIFEASSYFHQIKHKLIEVDLAEAPSKFVKKGRSDIAYIIKARRAFQLFQEMPYRLLPEVIFTFPSFPVRMTRPSPYEELFVIAMMRSLAAGALDKVLLDFRRRNFRQTESLVLRRKSVAKPLSLDSFDAMFVVWFTGCGIAFLVFVVECCFKHIGQCAIKKLGTLR